MVNRPNHLSDQEREFFLKMALDVIYQRKRTVYTVEWKDYSLKWHSQEFHIPQEATAFASFIEGARTVIVRESQKEI